MSLGRRRKWLANIKCSDLSSTQLATENSTLKILCGNHFHKNDPDWTSSINLGHSETLLKGSISCCERRKKRALERLSKETADQKTMSGKAEKNNEATAATSNTSEQVQAMEVQPLSSMSLNSAARQTE